MKSSVHCGLGKQDSGLSDVSPKTELGKALTQLTDGVLSDPQRSCEVQCTLWKTKNRTGVKTESHKT